MSRAAAAATVARAVGVAACALQLGGCAGTVRVTPLATGQVAVSAYELRGRDPSVLRAEAARLCQGVGVVLRQSGMSQQALASDGRVGRWLNQASDLLMLPTREAQLMVRCEPQPDQERLAPAASLLPELAPAAPYAVQRSSGRSGSVGSSSARVKVGNADTVVPYGY